jgi:hypothetical protein
MKESRIIPSLSRNQMIASEEFFRIRRIWKRFHCSRLMYFLFVVSTAVTTSAQSNGFDGKDLPEKGDVKCQSLADRYNNFKDGGDASVWLSPCEEGAAMDDPSEELPPNGIILQLFASLPAFSGGFRTLYWHVM